MLLILTDVFVFLIKYFNIVHLEQWYCKISLYALVWAKGEKKNYLYQMNNLKYI